MVLEENNEDSTSLKIAFEEVDLSEDESLVWNGISSSNFIMENFATAYAWFFFNLEEKFVVERTAFGDQKFVMFEAVY